MSEIKLLPCPFCGGEVQLFKDEWNKFGAYCEECEATVGVRLDKGWRAILANREEAIAAWNSRADARQHALKTRVCPMCEDCPDGCPVEMPKDSRNIVTNADCIRSMSDGELARFLWEQNGGNRYWKSVEKYLDWLKQPVKEE